MFLEDGILTRGLKCRESCVLEKTPVPVLSHIQDITKCRPLVLFFIFFYCCWTKLHQVWRRRGVQCKRQGSFCSSEWILFLVSSLCCVKIGTCYIQKKQLVNRKNLNVEISMWIFCCRLLTNIRTKNCSFIQGFFHQNKTFSDQIEIIDWRFKSLVLFLVSYKICSEGILSSCFIFIYF